MWSNVQLSLEKIRSDRAFAPNPVTPCEEKCYSSLRNAKIAARWNDDLEGRGSVFLVG